MNIGSWKGACKWLRVQLVQEIIIYKVWWPGLQTFVKNYVQGCGICQQFKINQTPSWPAYIPMEGTQTTCPFANSSMDLIMMMFDSENTNFNQFQLPTAVLWGLEDFVTAMSHNVTPSHSDDFHQFQPLTINSNWSQLFWINAPPVPIISNHFQPLSSLLGFF